MRNLNNFSVLLQEPLPPKATLIPGQISDALRYISTTKLSPSREATSLIRPLIDCNRGGVIRGGLRYYTNKSSKVN